MKWIGWIGLEIRRNTWDANAARCGRAGYLNNPKASQARMAATRAAQYFQSFRTGWRSRHSGQTSMPLRNG